MPNPTALGRCVQSNAASLTHWTLIAVVSAVACGEDRAAPGEVSPQVTSAGETTSCGTSTSSAPNATLPPSHSGFSDTTNGTQDGSGGEASSTDLATDSNTSSTPADMTTAQSTSTAHTTTTAQTTSNEHSDPQGTSSETTDDATSSVDATDAPFDGKELFLLFGQSNMSGTTPMPDEPWMIDERITFMVQYDCESLNQTKDEWLPAQPPLHGCQWATNGLGLGLGDYFGKAMAAAWQTSAVGLMPNAIPAVTIDIFMKGGPSPGGGLKALPEGYDSAYALMVDRARDAQQLGRIRAILLNQGESDFNQGFGDEWPGKVAQVVADLRADLGLTEDVPFVAGEVPPTGNYSGHNVNVHELPDLIPNCAVVTGEGTDVHDGIHYDQASVQIMGERYAEAVLQLLEQ